MCVKEFYLFERWTSHYVLEKKAQGYEKNARRITLTEKVAEGEKQGENS